jgi:hypothetical protein
MTINTEQRQRTSVSQSASAVGAAVGVRQDSEVELVVAFDDFIARGAPVLQKTSHADEYGQDQLSGGKRLPGSLLDSQESRPGVHNLKDDQSKHDEENAETEMLHQPFTPPLEFVDDFLLSLGWHDRLHDRSLVTAGSALIVSATRGCRAERNTGCDPSKVLRPVGRSRRLSSWLPRKAPRVTETILRWSNHLTMVSNIMRIDQIASPKRLCGATSSNRVFGFPLAARSS